MKDFERSNAQVVVIGNGPEEFIIPFREVTRYKGPLFEIPNECPGVPASILNPRKRVCNQGEYELRAVQLAKKFKEDFSRYESKMPDYMRTKLLDVLSLDDSFDMLEEFNFSI